MAKEKIGSTKVVSLGISPAADALLRGIKQAKMAAGQIITRRELADEAIIAAYGGKNG